MSALNFERETLRTLAGPQLALETRLEILDREELAGIQGGGAAGSVKVLQPQAPVTVPTTMTRESVGPWTLPI